MNPILYATDFSENAKQALTYALKMAQAYEAPLIMLHVFEIPTSWEHPHTDDPMEMEREAVETAENKLQGLLDQQAREKTKGVDIQIIAIESNSPVKGIRTVISEKEPALVVVGTKGASRIKEVIVGNTTKALISKSPRPVLAVPEDAPDSDLQKVVYASDFEKADIQALRQMIALLRPFEPDITIIHVSRPEEYRGDEKFDWFKELVRERVDYEKLSFKRLVSDHIYEQLNDYVREGDTDLLAMLERERHGVVDRLFHSDLVKRMEFHTTVPMLSFNEHYLKIF